MKQGDNVIVLAETREAVEADRWCAKARRVREVWQHAIDDHQRYQLDVEVQP